MFLFTFYFGEFDRDLDLALIYFQRICYYSSEDIFYYSEADNDFETLLVPLLFLFLLLYLERSLDLLLLFETLLFFYFFFRSPPLPDFLNFELRTIYNFFILSPNFFKSYAFYDLENFSSTKDQYPLISFYAYLN